jgi:Na+/H+ antiporter NhaD/arsenite permease-like protein
LRLHGGINLLWLLGIVLAVGLIVPGQTLPGTRIFLGSRFRETVMLAMAVLSLATTPRGLRRDGGFSYGAIAEVACLFLGIFLTMSVPIEILRSRGPMLGLTSPAHFFWASGSLSSVLDNAPTYLVFFETARALHGPGHGLVALFSGSAVRADLLAAVSLGSVFMGANTYIGNGPNFLVKSIAEQSGVKMPSFFGYMAYSGAVLIPLFLAVTVLFLR